MKAQRYLLLALIISCHQKSIDKNIDLVINLEQSYSYDLANEIYIVKGVMKFDSARKTQYVSGTPLEVKFHLTEEEKIKIKNKYYELEIDKMPDNERIEDSCLFKGFPAFFL